MMRTIIFWTTVVMLVWISHVWTPFKQPYVCLRWRQHATDSVSLLCHLASVAKHSSLHTDVRLQFPCFCTRLQQVGLLQQSPDRLASHSHPASPVSPKYSSKANFQPKTLWSHHRRDHQPSLVPRAGANYIQGGDADVSCSAWFRATLLGVVIHMCRRHAEPTQAQVRLHWTAWCSDLSSVNYRRSCLSRCRKKGVEWPAKRCYVCLVTVGVQEQAENILVPPLLRNCLTLNYISFS